MEDYNSELEYSSSIYEESTTGSGDQAKSFLSQISWNPYNENEEEAMKNQNKGRVGRKEAAATRIFSALRTKNDKPLKKEYVRCQIIRGIKKCVRHLLKHVIPNKGIHEFNPKNQEKLAIWRRMEVLVFANEDLFLNLGSTCEGPATDGKIIRKRQRLETPQYRSFNDEYCQRFYEQEAVREFHYLYLQLVYGVGSIDPEEMCVKLTVRCCVGQYHSEKCRGIWENVRDYVMFKMIDQLKLTPFNPPQAILFEEPTQEFFEELDVDDLLAAPQQQDAFPTTL